MKTDAKTISIIGLGYVGLPLALLAEKKGYRVIGIDSDKKKIELLKKKKCPFADEKISAELTDSYIEVGSDYSKIQESSITVICVPTPVYANHMPNLEPVESASKGVALFLKKGQLVVLESTVNPGVCESVVLPILEKVSGLKGGEDFYLAHCPERINPGDKNWTVENIPRVVGGLDEVSLRKAEDFYKSVISAEVKPMRSLKEAEAVKVVENSFRDINIAFVNELAMSFSKMGIDVVNVIDGASTKPFAFMPHFPGCGVGGHCIPVDPYYLIEYAKQNGFKHKFLSIARKINNQMPEFTVEQLAEGLSKKGIDIKGSKIAILGLAYKPDVSDRRESPSYKIINLLKKKGAEVATYDPYAREKSDSATLAEALSGAKGVIIATGHSAFKVLTPDEFLRNNVSVVVDGRNCLPKEKFAGSGLIYKGIGR